MQRSDLSRILRIYPHCIRIDGILDREDDETKTNTQYTWFHCFRDCTAAAAAARMVPAATSIRTGAAASWSVTISLYPISRIIGRGTPEVCCLHKFLRVYSRLSVWPRAYSHVPCPSPPVSAHETRFWHHHIISYHIIYLLLTGHGWVVLRPVPSEMIAWIYKYAVLRVAVYLCS